MISYNVFFTPKPGIGDDHVIAVARAFLDQLKAKGDVRDYRILRVTNPASFPTLPRFQAIVDYATQGELDASFSSMRQPPRFRDGAHGELADLVTDFKVSFTADA
jgi:hypothetical protein